MPVALFSYDRAANLIRVNLPSIRITRPPKEKSTATELAYLLGQIDDDDSGSVRVSANPYGQISWVNIAVTKIAQHVARARFDILRGEAIVESGPIHDLFRDVNPFLSRSQLWESTTSWLMMRGEAFWIPGLGEQLTDILYVVDPSTMKERVSESGDITMWEYKIDNRMIPYLPKDLIHFKLWNPWSTHRGVNPLRAMKMDLSMVVNATQANLSMLTNGGVPKGILESDNPTLDENQAKEIKERWQKEHGGSKRRNGISVLGAGVKYQQIQMSPEDMQFFTLMKWGRQTILARYGVPPAVAGVYDEGSALSGKDTGEQMRNFWEGTIYPLLRFFEDKLDTEFFSRYGFAEIGRFNIDHISELQEDRNALSERQRADVAAGLRTINEVRSDRGEDPVPWGDTWWMPLLLQPVSDYDAAPDPIESEPIKYWDATVTVAAMLEHKASWTPEYKDMHWKRVTRTWAKVEAQYRKELQDWVFAIRARTLNIASREKRGKAPSAAVIDEILDEGWWAAAESELRTLTAKRYREAIAATEPHVRDVLSAAGVAQSASWSIFNTRAVEMLNARLEKIGRITETIRNDTRDVLKRAVTDGLTDAEAAEKLGTLYNQAKVRCNTIARTEIGGVVNDAEIASYLDSGFEYHSWLDSRDADVRPSHQISETVRIGEPFSNGLRWPHDETAPVEEVVNCRCLTLPEKGEA